MLVRLAETTPLAEAGGGTPQTGSRKFRARLIEADIWGSSGYYSAAVLQEAVKDKVFAAGTMIFLDHPSVTEAIDRPERSVRDLAGKLNSDAVFERDGLYADVEVYPHVAPVIEAMAKDIGMSIRATAEVSFGDAAGRTGQIIERFDKALSVDFVTQAGAGGKVVSLVESLRATLEEKRSIGQWMESRLHRDFTITADDMAGDGRLTREERISLSSAIGDALTAFVARIEADQPQLYSRDLWDDPQDTVATAIEAAKNVPVTRPGSTTPTEESKEDPMPEIEAARLRELEEAHGRVPTLTTERDTAITRAETAESERNQVRQELAAERARGQAATHVRGRVTEANGDLPQATVDRIVAEATATVPLTEAGALDTAALDTAADQAREREETYLAGLAEARGFGRPRGITTRIGTGQKPGDAATGEVTEADVDAIIRRRAGTEQKGA